MASFVKFQTFVEALAEKVHDLGGDTLKMALTNTAPTPATDTVFAPGSLHPPPAAANGYAPAEAAHVTSAQTGGTYKLVLEDVVFTAVGGQIGPFRYAILYNDDAAADELIAYWDRGSSLTLEADETFTVDFDAGTGVLTIA
ncbi:MAG TPA: hypothetical protein VMW52_05795 [Phycisphaerae bacterium]|nr:hypothetical protein [Phycisphaerae bacterium]